MGMQGTVKDWRKDLLRDLENVCSIGPGLKITKVRWLTARDEVVCPVCASREGKYFTPKQVREILQGNFCEPLDEDDRCRCCFVADESCIEKTDE